MPGILIILIICLFVGFIAKTQENERVSHSSSFCYGNYNSSPTQNNTIHSLYTSMPTDAHDQVEALVHLIDEVYSAYPFAKNDFAKGSLYIYQEDGNTNIHFWYDWAFSGVRGFLEKKHSFGSGFTFRDDEWIEYKSSSVSNLRQWLWNDVLNRFHVDPAVATLQNNCPGLYITEQQVLDTGIMLKFSCH